MSNPNIFRLISGLEASYQVLIRRIVDRVLLTIYSALQLKSGDGRMIEQPDFDGGVVLKQASQQLTNWRLGVTLWLGILIIWGISLFVDSGNYFLKETAIAGSLLQSLIDYSVVSIIATPVIAAMLMIGVARAKDQSSNSCGIKNLFIPIKKWPGLFCINFLICLTSALVAVMVLVLFSIIFIDIPAVFAKLCEMISICATVFIYSYIQIRLLYALPLSIESKVGVFRALRMSWTITGQRWIKILFTQFLVFMIVLAPTILFVLLGYSVDNWVVQWSCFFINILLVFPWAALVLGNIFYKLDS